MYEPDPADPNANPHPHLHFGGPCDDCRARRFISIVGQLENKDDQGFLYHVYGDLLTAEAIAEECDDEDDDEEIHFDTNISQENIDDDDDKNIQNPKV